MAIKKPIALYDGAHEELKYPVDQVPLTDHVLDNHTNVNVPTPLQGQRLAWDESAQQWVPRTSQSALGFYQYHYRFQLPPSSNPSPGNVSRNNTDPALATFLYLNEIDRDSIDQSQFIPELKAGDWMNIYRSNDAGNFESYDIDGTPVKVGAVFQIPVVFFESAGAGLSNNNDVQVVIRRSPNYPHDVLVDRDAISSHPSTAISFDNTTNNFTAIDAHDAIRECLHPLGNWTQREYHPLDAVFQDGYYGYAVNITTDSLAPVGQGSPVYTLPDAPVWQNLSVVDTVKSGIRITNLLESFQVTGIRVWIPTITADAHYQVIIEDLITGIIQVGQKFDGDILTAPGWINITIKATWVLPGDNIVIYVISQNSSSSTLFNHPWTWAGSSNQEVDPGIGNANRRGDHSILRINKTDDDGTDRSAELANVTPGSTIKVTSEISASQFVHYEIVANETDNGTWVSYPVTLLDTGALGEPDINDRCQLYFDIPVAVSTDYVAITDQYLGFTSITGLIQIGEGATVENADAHGIDILYQIFDVSADWFIMSYPASSGGSSGGGVEEHNALSGIQGGDSGAGEYFHLSQLEVDRVNSRNIDGGSATSIYLPSQSIDAGGASG